MSANDNHKPLPPFPDDAPTRGETWQHKRTSILYWIVMRIYDEETLEHKIAYHHNIGEGFGWERPLSVFMEKFRRV